MFCKKGIHRNFTKFTAKHLCQGLIFNKVFLKFKEETLAQVFSCEFCEISKKTFLHTTPLVAASAFTLFFLTATILSVIGIYTFHVTSLFKAKLKEVRKVNLGKNYSKSQHGKTFEYTEEVK